MEVHDQDPQTPAERRGPQADAPARRWVTAGWILAAAFVAAMLLQACPADAQTAATWTYGAFADVGYLFAPNHPYGDLFRSRGTTWHLNDVHLNMAGAFVRRPPAAALRLGGEVTLHAGKDDEVFGFSATAPSIGGAQWLRHLGPTNVSYLAEVGKGLTIQGGIFSSYIGYDSLYAKDNFTYTRPWGADFTPYLMLGVNASYPVSETLTVTALLVNGYWHLASANRVPSAGAQLAYAVAPSVTVKHTVLAGPHQSTTSLGFWRVISDSIVERRSSRFTAAANYHFATERAAGTLGKPGAPGSSRTRAWWMSAQLPMEWHVSGPWRIAARPEWAWDSQGRWTLAEQTVTAFTATLEHRRASTAFGTSLKAEYRVDRSTGPQGGFFTERAGQLTPTQHLFIVGAVFRLDAGR